jgi:hypothetical protein
MGRARPAGTAIPDQLTLDGWEQILNARTEAPDTSRSDAASIDAPASAGLAEKGHQARGICAEPAAEQTARHHPVATELLETPGALLTWTHLRELGLERRAVDAVFRALPIVALPGYSRPMIRADQYVELVERSTYDDDRVRPSAAIMSRRPHGA